MWSCKQQRYKCCTLSSAFKGQSGTQSSEYTPSPLHSWHNTKPSSSFTLKQTPIYSSSQAKGVHWHNNVQKNDTKVGAHKYTPPFSKFLTLVSLSFTHTGAESVSVWETHFMAFYLHTWVYQLLVRVTRHRSLSVSPMWGIPTTLRVLKLYPKLCRLNAIISEIHDPIHEPFPTSKL